MAMNKKEQAEVAELRNQLYLARALGWSHAPEPERMPIPTGFNKYANGWDYNAYFGSSFGRPDAERAWTSSINHGSGHVTDPSKRPSASQNSKCLFFTRLDALVALRLELEKNTAKILAEVDRKIETEREKTGADQ